MLVIKSSNISCESVWSSFLKLGSNAISPLTFNLKLSNNASSGITYPFTQHYDVVFLVVQNNPLCKLYLVNHILSHLQIFFQFRLIGCQLGPYATNFGQGFDAPTTSASFLINSSNNDSRQITQQILLSEPMQWQRRHT